MNVLQVDKLSKSFGERVLFNEISFGLQEGQKTALIARNGAGKSTLMRIIAGREQADSGQVVFRNDSVMAFLEQDPAFNPEHTIEEAVFAWDDPRIRAVKNYEHVLSLPPSAERDAEIQEQSRLMDELKAWDIEARAKEVLGKLLIHDLNRKMSELSGGQRKRVSLAAMLIREPDVMLLDEPTNHLDVDMIEWLEGWLSRKHHTILMVTHDRYFLDKVCTDILEIDRETVQRYKGNYAYYLEKKEAFREAFNSEVEKARNLYARELEWMRRMPKARGTKAQARIDQFYDTKEKASQRLREDQIELSVKMNRLGGKILELIKVSKFYGDLKVINSFTYTFKKGEKIGIAGRNGTGKSTLLKIITGLIQPDSGKVILGDTVVVGYYSQDGMQIPDEKRVIEVVRDSGDVIPLADGRNLTASQLLNLFLFPPQMQYTPVGKLSGGEKRRLYLLTVLMKNPNFLILDEPTNDLDIQTLNILQDFLSTYPGCVLIVSHDRYFMDTLADHLFIFEGEGEIRDFNGNYTDYREELDLLEKQRRETVQKEKVIKESPAFKKNKPGFKEMHEFKQLEEAIPKLEQTIAEKTEVLNSGIADHEKLMQVSNEIAALSAELEEKSNRWLELAEIIEP
ncbi:MAG: ABC-F family ATP-binding cassette domain-containing protein [Bacteroidia bacterium]